MTNEKENNGWRSRIIGQAQVVFGGGVKVDVGKVKDRTEAFAIGLSELKWPTTKAGVIPERDDTFGVQVSLVFPDLATLSHFRDILNELEAEIKEQVKQREAQQSLDFDDVDPHHLVHQHEERPIGEDETIDVYFFDRHDLEKKLKQKDTDFSGMSFKSGTGLRRFPVLASTVVYETNSHHDGPHGTCFRQNLKFLFAGPNYITTITDVSDEIGMPEERRLDIGIIWKDGDQYQILYSPKERIRHWNEGKCFHAENFNEYPMNYIALTDEEVKAMCI